MKIEINGKELGFDTGKLTDGVVTFASALSGYSIYKMLDAAMTVTAEMIPSKTGKVIIRLGGKILGAVIGLNSMALVKKTVAMTADSLLDANSDDYEEVESDG